MPSWSPEQYLKYADERARPCLDLIAQLALENPARVVDLGCGPGNSTVALAKRFPLSRIDGIDSSTEMIAIAKESQSSEGLVSKIQYQMKTIEQWITDSDVVCDLVFTNAALQWVSNHSTLLPKICRKIATGGCFALQVPSNMNAPAHTAMRELSNSAKWRPRFSDTKVREWYVHEPSEYYDLVSEGARSVNIWQTEYLHVLNSIDDIVEWYKGSGLRPYLDILGDKESIGDFLNDFRASISELYRSQQNGKVLLPFERLFLIAYF